MTYDELIAYYGNPTAAAAAVGFSRQVLHGWKIRGSIPLDQQCKYEIATGGKLRADLPKQLRSLISRKTRAAGIGAKGTEEKAKATA